MTFSRFTHPCVITGVLTDVCVEEEVMRILVIVFVVKMWDVTVLDMFFGV